MDDVRIGNAFRVIRIRSRLRQADVARRARVSRQTIGRLESGAAGRYALDTIRAVATALGIRIDVIIRWRGAELDRVLAAAHAELHESVAARLAALPGWVWLPEVTFAHFAERGVIDILAWHAATRSLLIIEIKTELVDPQGLVATMHRRVRLGRIIARQHGWEPSTVSAWVIVRDTSTERRRVARHAHLLRTAFPAEGRTMRGWLRHPHGRVSALSFWSYGAPQGTSEVSGRVMRVRGPSADRSGAKPKRGAVAGRPALPPLSRSAAG
jgi:transcriptional regulator with XRE-family HTH domain